MKIALRQSAGVPCDVAANLALVQAAAREAAAAGARLVIFPECFLTGYNIGERVRDLAEPADGPSLARAGVDLLAVPTSLMTPADTVALLVVPTRARENQIFVAYANRLGREAGLDYVGRSCIAGPDGADLARAGVEEELLVAEIDLSAIGRARARYDYLADCRAGLDVN